MEHYGRREILIARIPNSDGTPAPYVHPCIYLGESRSKPNCVVVIGVTSDLSQRIESSVDMPCGVETGLAIPSIAQTTWVMHVPHDCVRNCIGFTPQQQQLEINACIERTAANRKGT